MPRGSPGSREGRLPFRGYETWFRVVGDLDPLSTLTPVVLCHGGPGAGHDYIEPMEGLASSGRACVFYDQLGCGRSTHLPDALSDFWTVELFESELRALLSHVGIEGRYAVLGQSWGGMLAMEHALTHPDGLRAVVVCDSPASIPLWIEEASRLRAQLPAEVQATLAEHEEHGTTDDPAYEAATMVYYERHVCRRIPFPDCVQRTFAAMAEDPTVYQAMNGPSEFHVIGSLREWDITERLDEIDVPTLLVSGRYDEATPRIVGEIYARIPGAQWAVFAESSHMPHVEEPEAFLERVDAFLASVD